MIGEKVDGVVTSISQSEQLRLSVLIDLVGFKHADNTVISEGQTGSYEGWSDKLFLGDGRIPAVRDLEVIYPALSPENYRQQFLFD